MPNSPATWHIAQHPWRIAALLLLLAMLLEYVIMLVLPAGLESRFGRVGTAVVDAALLSLLLTPCLWWIVVQPLQRLAAARRQLLNWAMQSEERRAAEIARDLHDGVGQLAAALNLGLRAIELRSEDPVVTERTQYLRDVGQQLHDSVRAVSRGLRPRTLDRLGLAAAVEHFAEECRQASCAAVTVDVAALQGARLSRPVETAMFRVIQEAVTNSLRHGHPENVRVRLWREAEHLCLEVVDDGCGFDVESTMAVRMAGDRVPFGLFSMRERVELLGGRVELRSQPGAGVSIQACVPWLEEKSA